MPEAVDAQAESLGPEKDDLQVQGEPNSWWPPLIAYFVSLGDPLWLRGRVSMSDQIAIMMMSTRSPEAIVCHGT